MRTLKASARAALRALVVLGLLWSVVSALFALLVFVMVRERYGRSGPFSASHALALLNPQRRFLHAPVDTLLRVFRVKEGDTVLELGPGPGYFTLGASRVVGPTGRVVCVDVQPGMVSILEERLRVEKVLNTHPVVGDATRLPLADQSVDVAFLVTVLGEIHDRPAALVELRRVMKPGAVLSVMEGLNDPDYQLEASVRDLCRAVGFEELARERQRLGYVRSFVAP
ncbi:MAG: methyltransferase domain-containing protein [Chloroflexota bacterium]|nr:methyltransferase domain-containing protein [Chloroflexota bacterium]